MTLLVAGHETTAALLAWALQELAAHPRLQERLAEGQEGLADAVVQETLRLHPPVPLVLRRLRRPMRLAGRDLPEGATVAPCALIVHRRPDLWERPREFRPERFMDGRAPAGTLFPFGGGVRRCIGASFATFEARIVLEEVVSRFRLEPAGRALRGVGRRGIVLVPRRGGPVVARPRG
jgi:cytochrome P450 family 135